MEAHPQPIEADTEEVSTWTKLSIRLGVSIPTLANWRRLPESPKTPALKAWQDFVAQKELGLIGNFVGKGREELLKENLTKKNRLLDLEIANKERRSVDRAEVDSLLLHVGSLAKATLYPALERELPAKAEGRTAAEIALVGREIADRICEVFAANIEQWKQG